MKGKDLHEIFLNDLLSLYPSRKELIDALEDILKIGRESIARRLNGKVLFTATEIGRIAEKLNISIDYILTKESNSIFLPLNLYMPHTMESSEEYIRLFYNDSCELEKTSKCSPLHIGYIFDTLPIEFYISHEHLCKYMCFKSMSFYIKNKFYEDYSTWQIPEKMIDYHSLLMNCLNNAVSIFYIWNNTVIWNLMKDINFSYKLRLIKNEDVQLIKHDLHTLIDNILARAKEVTNDTEIIKKTIDLYVLTIDIDFSCGYFTSPTETLIQYRTPVPYSKLCKNSKEFYTVYNWLNSMKKLSTLVSNSAIVERNLFFEEQHEIIERI